MYVLLAFNTPGSGRTLQCLGTVAQNILRASPLGDRRSRAMFPDQAKSVLGIGAVQGPDQQVLEHFQQRDYGDTPGRFGVVDLQLHRAAQGCYHFVDVVLQIGRWP